tara:strand:+ start:1579 stop:2658 length:1080 start_codon:yes stop_codon:yes gene_type:complete
MIKDRKLILLLLFAVAAFLVYGSAYIVKEGEQAVVFQFGKPVGNSISDAGLKFKVPFIQNVKKFEKRILEWDGDPTEIPLEGKYILVDAFARWRISEPQLFYKSVMDVSGAQSRLDDIINGIVRDEISDSKLKYVIPNTVFNKKYDQGELKEGDVILIEGEELSMSDELCVLGSNKEGQIDGIWTTELNEDNQLVGVPFCDVGKDQGRQKIVKAIIAKVQDKFNSEKMGIEVVDIQIKRINYTDAVRNSVFTKTRSEQDIRAGKLKSEGRQIAEKILGEMDKVEKDISSSAYMEAQRIRGRGDSLATKILRQAHSKDPDFYRFYKALNALEDIIGKDDQVVLTTESVVFRILKTPEIPE